MLWALPSAAQLRTFAGWDTSPETYFLTEAERKEWRAVSNDQEAVAFIAKFRARRGGDSFKAEIDRRAGTANAFFTANGVQGWKTLRGKLVMLLGVPSSVHTSAVMGKRATGPSKPPPEAVTDLGGGLAPVPRLSGMNATASHYVRFVTLRFPAGNLAAFKGREFSIVIEVDAANGRESLVRRRDSRELNRLLEAAIDEALRRPRP